MKDTESLFLSRFTSSRSGWDSVGCAGTNAFLMICIQTFSTVAKSWCKARPKLQQKACAALTSSHSWSPRKKPKRHLKDLREIRLLLSFDMIKLMKCNDIFLQLLFWETCLQFWKMDRTCRHGKLGWGAWLHPGVVAELWHPGAPTLTSGCLSASPSFLSQQPPCPGDETRPLQIWTGTAGRAAKDAELTAGQRLCQGFFFRVQVPGFI